MRFRLLTVLTLLLAMGVIIASQLRPASPLLAQAGSGYVLTLATTTAGGTAVAGAYQVDVAIGQAEAGLQTGGLYELGGGYWGGGPPTTFSLISEVYLPLIVR